MLGKTFKGLTDAIRHRSDKSAAEADALGAVLALHARSR